MIPKLLHFVCLGNVPKWVDCNVSDWCAAQPDHFVRMHHDARLLLPEFREMFEACECIGDQAELLQYSILQHSILQQVGGWMLHCDTAPQYPGCLDKLAEEHPITTELLVQGGRTKYPDVWCMAATPECTAWPEINHILPGQKTSDHKIARYGAKMLRAIHHNRPELLHLAHVGEHIIHEFRDGWREPPIITGEGADDD